MIYADHAATTPLRPEVVELMHRILRDDFGNPSNTHYAPGRAARAHVDRARERVAAAIGAEPAQLYFTSGATESCNLAIIGIAQRLLGERPRMVAPSTEHPCVLEPMRACAEAGADDAEVAVDQHGRPDHDALEAAIDERTALVAAMLVNNETGVINDVGRIAELAHAHGALLLCDATQALGRLQVDVEALGCDLLACTAHKSYGPKGSGALWLRRGLAIAPQIVGGGQERGLRSGTENVAGVAGFGLAAELADAGREQTAAHLTSLQERFEGALRAGLPDLQVHGAGAERAPGTSFVTCPGLPRGWLAQLVDVCASGGSACSTGSMKGAKSLRAMGVNEHDAQNAVRISFGRDNTPADADHIVDRLVTGAERLRGNAKV